MRNYLQIMCLLILGLTVGSCENRSFSNLPPLVKDEIPKVNAGHIVSICLDDLQPSTYPDIWEQFFKERSADEVWNRVRKNTNCLDFHSVIKQQSNDVIAGIIRYLVCRNQTYLRSLSCIDFTNDKCKETTYTTPVIDKFVNLTKLDLSNSRFNSIPSEIGKLFKLTMLDLSRNSLNVIPPEIGELTSLEIFDLSNNKLKLVPPEIGNLTSLWNINISSNYLQELPIELTKLTGLTVIDLCGNQLNTIPSTVYSLVSLTDCDLSYNKLTLIDAPVSRLTNLSRFRLFKNNIERIPAQISSLVELEWFDIGYNIIKEIPTEIGKLTNLKELNLSNNKLQVIPKEIDNLASLNEFNVSSNQLTKLPGSMLANFNRQKCAVTLDNNPWLDVHYGGLSRGSKEEIRRFAYQHFPFSLFVLCMQLIEEHPELYKGEKHIIPKEVRHGRRKKLLRQAYEWKGGKNFVCFKKIKNNNVPFYLNFSLARPRDVELMLEELKEVPIYQVSND